ncbi:MAG TPA: chemotaxis protein CheB [Thermoanaerobaculia bacterium]|nr:chemotaxis protein CheB [Thermoanaerobaculia bacterium]
MSPSEAPAASQTPARVVAIAASAGGLSALTHVLTALPAGFGAPIIVLQHLRADQKSFMAEILGRRVALPVASARHGERLTVGKVYVAPPGRHLLVLADGVLALSDTERVRFVRPAADVLFHSLAESLGPRAVAVVLTGTGKDGADGVREIHRRGGTVIVQDEASSQFFGMPGASIKTGMVDRVLPLDEIAPALVALTRGGER